MITYLMSLLTWHTLKILLIAIFSVQSWVGALAYYADCYFANRSQHPEGYKMSVSDVRKHWKYYFLFYPIFGFVVIRRDWFTICQFVLALCGREWKVKTRITESQLYEERYSHENGD